MQRAMSVRSLLHTVRNPVSVWRFPHCPCVQFYAGNFVKDEKGKNGHVYHERYGFCLETQVEPNAVNVEDFHSPILLPGEEYSSETVYRFFVK